jgi:hypothetical protein
LTSLKGQNLVNGVPLAQLPASVLINGSGASGQYSTALGYGTTASGWNSTALGYYTTASGQYSTALGNWTTASGVYSTALGNNAQATNGYTFVWADGQSGPFTSTTNNQFSVRAGGGVRFVTGGAGLTVDGQPMLTNLNAAQLTGTIPLARLPAAVLTNGASGVSLTGSFTGDGSGLTNLNAAQLPAGVLTNYASGVTLSGRFTGDGSGLNNLNAQNLINGVPLEQLPASVLINGGIGGHANGYASTALGDGTTASGANSTALGDGTTASGYASTALGYYTTASGVNSTALGYFTTASGTNSTAMGFYSIASGTDSTAMGFNAQATNDYSFVWADSLGWPFTSTTTNEFSVRAGGGVRFVTGGAGVTVDGQRLLTNGASGVNLTGSFTGNGSGLTNIPAAAFVAPPPGMVLIPAGAFTMGDNLDGLYDAVPTNVMVSAFYMDVNLVS